MGFALVGSMMLAVKPQLEDIIIRSLEWNTPSIIIWKSKYCRFILFISRWETPRRQVQAMECILMNQLEPVVVRDHIIPAIPITFPRFLFLDKTSFVWGCPTYFKVVSTMRSIAGHNWASDMETNEAEKAEKGVFLVPAVVKNYHSPHLIIPMHQIVFGNSILRNKVHQTSISTETVSFQCALKGFSASP